MVGRPNVGKSTLVNRLVGQKVSITSSRPQTTRSPIRGVRNGPGYQAIFVDTPGSQKPRDTLRARMQEQVVDSLSESDVILLLFDAAQASEGLGSGDRYVARLVAGSGTPAIVSINKTDLLPNPDSALPIVEEVSRLGDWNEVFQISAAEWHQRRTSDGLHRRSPAAWSPLFPRRNSDRLPRVSGPGRIRSGEGAERAQGGGAACCGRRDRRRRDASRTLRSSTPSSTSNAPHSV